MMNRILAALAALAFASLLPTEASWSYTAGEGKVNNMPYSGTITDGNWTLRVYRPDADSDDFWLGCGGASGGGGRVEGSGALDLSTLLDDTTVEGQSVRIVNVARRALHRVQGNLTSLVLPNTVTNIGNAAFEQCSITSLDLRNTKVRRIGGAAFAWCTSLAEVWLPDTLESIGMIAFRTMPDKVTFHFGGDVPLLDPPTDSNPGSDFWAYVSKTDYQNVFHGSAGKQWAFGVNAEKYPNWKKLAKATYYDEENPFPSGEANWIPASVRYTANTAYAAPFGNTWFSRTGDTSAGGRTYLVQEGAGDGTVIARPLLGDAVLTQKRDAVAVTIPLSVGTGGSVEVSFTFNGETQTKTVAADEDLTYEFTGLPESTTYSWSIAVAGDGGSDALSGTVATQPPDIVLGDATQEQTKDGRTSTVSVAVTSLSTETGTLVFSLNGAVVSEQTITATGTYTAEATDLTLGTEYTWTVTARAGADEDEKSVSFTAERYKWTYTPGAGNVNRQPFTGTITDKNWTLRVYKDPDGPEDAFWLGCGGTGAAARVAGSGELDLTQLLADTTEDGTPVRIVNVANSAFKGENGNLTGTLLLPQAVTNIGVAAFGSCRVSVYDFRDTRLVSVQRFAFEWCNNNLSEVWFPKTLRFVGACAFVTCTESPVFHFLGPAPELEETTTLSGSAYSAYLSIGGYSNFIRGGNNTMRIAFCVDTRLHPSWARLADTTWYTEENPFPSSSESGWVPLSVRYTANDAYAAPLGNTKWGRSDDTRANARSYVVYEKHGDLGLSVIVR